MPCVMFLPTCTNIATANTFTLLYCKWAKQPDDAINSKVH